jgi:hypothetical protein
MRMIIRYQNGPCVVAALLAANTHAMRVAIEFQRATAEFHRVDGCWYTDSETPIEIDALIAFPGVGTSTFCGAVKPRAIVAGQGFSL